MINLIFFFMAFEKMKKLKEILIVEIKDKRFFESTQMSWNMRKVLKIDQSATKIDQLWRNQTRVIA